MKYIFVINPGSGKRRKQVRLLNNIEAAVRKMGVCHEIYYTAAEKDGERYVRELCERNAASENRQKLRIYACGGDGTINEVVNGAFGYDDVEIGAVPLGTGNDYIRNYGEASDFLNIERQLAGESVCCDLISYSAEYDGMLTEGYCANMFNIGFDCNVVDMTSQVKRWPLVGGSLAYLISVAIILIEKKGADLRIEYEDGTVLDGRILLIAIANGCFCGGGVKGVPLCQLDDGLMDVSVVKNIGRLLFILLFPSYSKGTHLEKKKVKDGDVIRYSKEKRLTVTANGESLRLCTDGEITTQKRVEFGIVRNGFRFIVPRKKLSIAQE